MSKPFVVTDAQHAAALMALDRLLRLEPNNGKAILELTEAVELWDAESGDSRYRIRRLRDLPRPNDVIMVVEGVVVRGEFDPKDIMCNSTGSEAPAKALLIRKALNHWDPTR